MFHRWPVEQGQHLAVQISEPWFASHRKDCKTSAALAASSRLEVLNQRRLNDRIGPADSIGQIYTIAEDTKMTGDSSLDPVALDPDKFTVRLENGRVRVLEARIAPGHGHGLHRHPAHLIYTLSPYNIQDTFPDGSTKTIKRDAGELVWGDELTHATENIGETAIHAIIIELKTQ